MSVIRKWSVCLNLISWHMHTEKYQMMLLTWYIIFVMFSLAVEDPYIDGWVITMLPLMTSSWLWINVNTMRSRLSTLTLRDSCCWPTMTLLWSASPKASTKRPSFYLIKQLRERSARRVYILTEEVPQYFLLTSIQYKRYTLQVPCYSSVFLIFPDCFFRQNDFNFALQDYCQALDLDPEDENVKSRISVIYNEFGVTAYQDKNFSVIKLCGKILKNIYKLV